MNQLQITQTGRERKPNPLALESNASRRRVSRDRGRTRRRRCRPKPRIYALSQFRIDALSIRASTKDKPIAFSTIFRQLRRSFAGAGCERINQNSELDHWEAACVALSERFSIKRSRREFLVDVFSQ